MMGKGAAVPAALERLQRHHLQCAQAGVAGIVKQHGNVFVEFFGQVEASVHVRFRVGVRELDPGNAADHVGAEPQGLAHQVQCARLAHDAILGEGNDLNVDNAAKLVTHAEERPNSLETRLAIDVGKSADMQIPVDRRERGGAPCILDDPRLCVFLLDLAGKLDACHGLSHRLAVIGLPRLLFHHRQRPNLAEVKVRIDVGLSHQVAAGVDLVRRFSVEALSHRDDKAVSNSDVEEPIAAAPQPSAANGDVQLSRHDRTTGWRGVCNGCG
jgi:hypothetical protein